MPYINVKVLKDQVSPEAKRRIVVELTEIVVRVMKRDPSLTTIVVDEIGRGSWAIGGKEVDSSLNFVSFVNLKVSKGTTDHNEMSEFLKETKSLMSAVLGNQVEANYCIVDELNPDAWGFDGVTMSERSKLEGQ